MTPTLLIDLALAPVAGYLGTKAMEPVSAWMYERESQADRDREDAVRPGPPYRIAAQKTTARLGLDLSEVALDKAALVFHYGLAVSWAPTYAVLRRRTRMGSVAAGLASGAAMSALVDEGLTPALGFSAPNRAYPAAAHVRGVVVHLAFGLAVAAVTGVGHAAPSSPRRLRRPPFSAPPGTAAGSSTRTGKHASTKGLNAPGTPAAIEMLDSAPEPHPGVGGSGCSLTMRRGAPVGSRDPARGRTYGRRHGRAAV